MDRNDQPPASLTRRQWLALAAGGATFGLSERLAGSAASQAAQGRAPGAVISFPPGAVIRTLTSDIDPQTLSSGVTLIHEHPALAVRDDLVCW